MTQLLRLLVLSVLWLSVCQLAQGGSVLLAQGGGTGVTPEERQKKADELLREARRAEMTGYILGAAGFLIILAAIPISIYLDRKKKARKEREAGRKRKPGGESAT